MKTPIQKNRANRVLNASNLMPEASNVDRKWEGDVYSTPDQLN